MTTINIAIDGPGSAGKSTIAKKVAKELGLIYLDTGAMYRALTLHAMRTKSSLDNEQVLLSLLEETTIRFVAEIDGQHTLLNEEDVTEAIRQPAVTKNVSLVSSHAEVRAEMVRRQQDYTKKGGVVMDGRDIGTVVMPDAKLKIFLVADVHERARRRFEEFKESGMDVTLESITEDLKRRDHFDSTRKASPLKKADDAIEIDSTKLSIDEVVKRVIDLANASNR